MWDLDLKYVELSSLIETRASHVSTNLETFALGISPTTSSKGKEILSLAHPYFSCLLKPIDGGEYRFHKGCLIYCCVGI